MGSKNKLKRFKENETFKNVIQPTREELVKKDFVLKGKWNKDFFKNKRIVLMYVMIKFSFIYKLYFFTTFFR